ncbi:MAG: hypothetical protein J5676_01750 [Bacteroidaceae bacterium]|nr:hypothetical protein [Bacteroidaceae bacterium]
MISISSGLGSTLLQSNLYLILYIPATEGAAILCPMVLKTLFHLEDGAVLEVPLTVTSFFPKLAVEVALAPFLYVITLSLTTILVPSQYPQVPKLFSSSVQPLVE